MTRKDYVKIAGILRGHADAVRDGGENPTPETLAIEFADMLAADNPRFNRARFLEACGV